MYKLLFSAVALLLSLQSYSQFNTTEDTFSRIYGNVGTHVYDGVYLDYMPESKIPYLGEFFFNVSFPYSGPIDSLYGAVLFDADKGPAYFFSYAGDPVEGSTITMHDYVSHPVYIFEARDDRWNYYDSGTLTYYTRGPENYLEVKMGPVILEYTQ